MKFKHKLLRQAIDKLCSHGQTTTEETYTRLILECSRSNDVEQAKKLQSHMDFHSYRPTNTFIHNRLLHLYAKSGKISYARDLFDKMPKRDIFSWNAMLSAHVRAGSIEDLRKVFDEMPFRDSVSYNTVIAGFASHGFAKLAVEVFLRMRGGGCEPSDYTLVSLLTACAQLLDLRRGKQIHGRIVIGSSSGSSLGSNNSNVFVWNALTDMYAKCGDIDKARWLFDKMNNKNLVTWNLMISGYLKKGQTGKCIDLFYRMQASGLKPDDVTVSNVLGAYFRSGSIDEASSLFHEMKEKDNVCWTTMIVGCGQNGKEEDALMLFREMLTKDVKPDSFTLSSVVSSCAKLASLYYGQVVHGKAIFLGVDDDLLVSSALMDMYCKCGVTGDALVVFDMMPNKNVICWNTLINGYAQNGQDLEALTLYDKMLGEGLKPDSFTFVAVLSACVHSGMFQLGQEYFDSISDLHGLTPSLDHYACMINLLGHSGNFDKAVELIKSMPHKPNSLIWSTLLSVCAMKGEILHGEMAAKHLFEVDPFNAGPYIMLSNMYAACGRWDDVASIRALMKSKNVKKFAAYSWIEIDDKVHKFVSEDRSHPETESIYKELRRLIEKVEEAGFAPNTKLVLHDVGHDEKVESICYHSEKLALAYGLMKKPNGDIPIRIMKNIRVCGDCHAFMKFVSKIIGRSIVLRDSNRFHHFVGGKCSCKDYW